MIPTMNQFRHVVEQEFSFMTAEHGFAPPIFAETGGDLVATFEDARLAIAVECGKRDADVWTLVKNIAVGRQLGLDSFHALSARDPDYPPSMGGRWESLDELLDRLSLEARILRANFPALLEHTAAFEEAGSPLTTEAVQLEDPVGTFPKHCAERLAFLVEEFGLRLEVESQSEVLFIGADRAVRVDLLDTSYEHEDEAYPTLVAYVAPIIGPGGELAPVWEDDVLELTIADRDGPFSAEYLERAFDELEDVLRSLEPQLRQRARA